MKILIFINVMLLCISVPGIALAITLRQGDLLFQDLDCGELCNAITTVTSGYNNLEISHVGMVVSINNGLEVIEAHKNRVQLTPLSNFLQRSVDIDKKPRVIVGRLISKYRYLIPEAVRHALSWQGLPYNYNFSPHNDYRRFYCSQLIQDAFKLANHSKIIFNNHKMTFKSNGRTLKDWHDYFKLIKSQIPEGQLGTNPGMMSRSQNINIIFSYSDKMRKVNKN